MEMIKGAHPNVAMNQGDGHRGPGAGANAIHSILLSRWYLPTVLVVAAAMRLVWILFFQPNPVSDFAFYFRSAESIAQGFGYNAHGTPTAYFPVGYPLFLGMCFRIFGVSVTVAEVANLICSMGSLALAYGIARQLFKSEVAGRLSLLFLAVYPNDIAYTSLVSVEVLYVFLLLLGVALVLPCIATNAPLHPGRLILAGLAFGVATLVKVQTLLLPVFLLLLIPQFSWEGKSLVNRMKKGAVLYVALILVLCPWIVRNYEIYNDIVLSNNGGTNLYIGNGPEADGTWVEPPVFDTSEGVMHDYYNDQAARREAIVYIATHPWRTLALLPKKFLALFDHGDGMYWNDIGTPNKSASRKNLLQWLSQANAIYESTIYVGVAAAFLFAVWKRLQTRSGTGWSRTGTVVILYFVAVYLAYYGARRYNFPIMPWMIMYSAAFLSSLVPDASQKKTSGP